MRKYITLAELPAGKRARIIGIHGGHKARLRLYSMGIREGIEIKKLSGLFHRAPSIIEVGNAQIAIGFGIARRILVEVLE